MPSLADLQRTFAVALLDPALPPPAGLVGPDGKPSSRRFGVYRNNVIVGLTQTLKDAYPAIHRIVGSEFFGGLARAFAIGALPPSPMLFDYGAGFPDFIDRFEPACVLPYLADVARIERAWIEAYHSAEAAPIEASALSGMDASVFPEFNLILHPSVRVLRSRFPALTIWQMNVGGGVPRQLDLAAGGEDALVVRPDAEVEVRPIPKGSADFILALSSGTSVLAAFKQALLVQPGFDLAANLTDLIRVGAVIGLGTARVRPVP